MLNVENSTYLEQAIEELQNGVAREVFFNETQPTVVTVKNTGSSKLYVFANSLVSADKYDFMLLPGESKTLIKPQGTRYVYILSMGSDLNYGYGKALVMSAISGIYAKDLEGIKEVKVIPSAFTGRKITLSAGTQFRVKTTAGYIAAITTALTDLIVTNGFDGGDVWKGNYSAGLPIFLDQDIRLTSAAGGDVYIVYK